MGSNLRRQLREALPETVRGLPRAVALEIADDARWDDAWRYDPEKGRRSKARLADLVRWTASKNERVIRDALRNLSLAGWEFRLPMGKDRKGNLLYAVPGHALEFRVPDFEAPTVVGPTSEGTVTTGPIGTVTTGPSSEGPVTTAEGPVVTAEGPVTTVAATVTTGPPSPVSSFSPKESPSTTSVAEDSAVVGEEPTTEEGGGGGSLSLEEIKKQCERVDAFVASLDFRGKQPGKQQRLKLGQRIMVAFTDGWTEQGLRRYLDISDDPTIRTPAAVYLHRLSEDELPEAAVPVSPQLPPACWDCLGLNSAAATDPAVRVNPITGDPCPNCHPGTVGQTPEVPPACQACREENPASRTNVRVRYRVIDGEMQACPDCHPKRIVILAAQNSQQDGADGGMWDRAMDRAQQRMQNGDWRGAGPDERVAGWAVVGRQLGAKERPKVGRNYSNDVWHQPADPAKAAKIPHCGDPGCDPFTRLKTKPDWTGEPHTSMCGDCHPDMKF